MIAAERLVQKMCVETRAGRSWILTLSKEEAPAWLAFHGPQGAGGEPPVISASAPRIELWPAGGANRPVVALPVAANQDLRGDLHRLGQRRLEPFNGWLLMLGLVHALDEASRTRPRIATVGDGVTATGVTTLGAWTSALTLADLQSALLHTHD